MKNVENIDQNVNETYVSQPSSKGLTIKFNNIFNF